MISTGVCSLYNGDLDTAETYLLLAARWAQSHHHQHQIAALSNLGAFSLYQIGSMGHSCPDEMSAAKRGFPHLRRHLSSVAESVDNKSLLNHSLVKDALAYWTEALNVINLPGPAKAAAGVRTKV